MTLRETEPGPEREQVPEREAELAQALAQEMEPEQPGRRKLRKREIRAAARCKTGCRLRYGGAGVNLFILI